MNRNIASALVSPVILILSVLVNGQTPHPPQQSRSNDGIQTESPKRSFDHNETIKQKYDKFKDLTSISLTMQITGDKVNGLAVLLTDAYLGNKPKPKEASERLDVIFLATGTTRRYKQWDTLIILADGERLRAGQAFYYADNPVPAGRIETIAFLFPYETLRTIVSAKKVEVQLGEAEFTFTEPQLEALRDFYSRIVP